MLQRFMLKRQLKGSVHRRRPWPWRSWRKRLFILTKMRKHIYGNCWGCVSFKQNKNLLRIQKANIYIYTKSNYWNIRNFTCDLRKLTSHNTCHDIIYPSSIISSRHSFGAITQQSALLYHSKIYGIDTVVYTGSSLLTCICRSAYASALRFE